MDLSKRLFKAAEYINCDTMADIGTDHGYLPIYLIQSGRSKKCIATDVNKGPLSRCRENADKAGYSALIETRIGNGLSCICENEVDTIAVCGMGGILISSILTAGADVAKSCKSIVIQPQTHWHSVRKTIHSIEFSIIDEEMVFEDGMFYTIMNCVPGNEKYSEIEYLFGKKHLAARNGIFLDYIRTELDKSKHAALRIGRSAISEQSRIREAEFIRHISLLEDYLADKL